MICEVGTDVMSSLMFGISIAFIEYFLWLSTELTRYSFVLMVSSCPPAFAVDTEVSLPLKDQLRDGTKLEVVPSVKLLGLEINTHVEKLCIKCPSESEY